MCKYAKIQKNLVESIQKSILYETEQMNESYTNRPNTFDPSWRLDNISRLHRALDSAQKNKCMYGLLHDIGSNYRCGFVSEGEAMTELFETCRNYGGYEMFYALMEQPEVKKQFLSFVRAAAKMLDTERAEFDDFQKWLQS